MQLLQWHSKGWRTCGVNKEAQKLLDLAQLEVRLLKVDLPPKVTQESTSHPEVTARLLKVSADNDDVIHVHHHPDAKTAKVTDHGSHKAHEEPQQGAHSKWEDLVAVHLVVPLE
jgi:hypothetical protein